MITVENVVILTEAEYTILKNEARQHRENLLTEEERDAIVYAFRMLRMADLVKSPDAERLAKTLADVWKKLRLRP